MTAALLDHSQTRQTRRPARPSLRLLDQAASRRRARHRSALLVLLMAVLIGFFAVAFVHAELVAGQHELDAVRAEIAEVEVRHAELARSVEEASAPAVITGRATEEFGMVPAHRPVYLEAAAPVRSIEIGTPVPTIEAAVIALAATPVPAAAVTEHPAPRKADALAQAGASANAGAGGGDGRPGATVPSPAGSSAVVGAAAGTSVASAYAGSTAAVGPGARGRSATDRGDDPGTTGFASVAAATATG